MKLRPGLKEFANAMERVLHNHSNQGRHWRYCDKAYLLRRLIGELGELAAVLLSEDALTKQHSQAYCEDRVQEECCDVANFAMMIADNFGGIRKRRKDKP